MRYSVTLAGRRFEVEVEGGQVTVDGVAAEAHLAAVPGTPVHHLLLGGASWTVAAEPPGGSGEQHAWVLAAVGERFRLEVVDERTREIQALASAGARPPGSAVVAAPMPGLVVRVEVEEGQRVDTGAGLVVVEAMKMQNELRAPRPGVVARVHVAVGQTVEKGAALVTVESPEPSG